MNIPNLTITAPPSLAPFPANPTEADTLIQKGIQMHEELNLVDSTAYFCKAAQQGSPLAMYLYGLALKSGWGCSPDRQGAFHWFSKAADQLLQMETPQGRGFITMAVSQVGTDQRGMEETVLGMVLYELAYGYKDGRGTKKCKSLSHFYLSLAAHIGDPHAQLDLATNYLYGIGVKSNKKLAARFFRLASQAGLEVPGNAWIWKSKYDYAA